MNKAHLSALSEKHAEIEARIHSEKQRPLPNNTLIASLKREKLKLKEEIVGL